MDKYLSIAQIIFGLNRAMVNVNSDNRTTERIGGILTKLRCKKAVVRNDTGNQVRVWKGITARKGTQTEQQAQYAPPPEPEGR